MMKIPRRFEPSDEELINHYLLSKILNAPIPESGTVFIPEATVYGEKLNPWEKFFPADGYSYPWQCAQDDMGKEADYDRLIVFSKVTSVGKKKGNNFQKKRAAGDGTWHGNNKIPVICNGNKIGYSMLLTFRSSNGRETLGHWTMNEYTIDPAAYPGLPASDWVICKIKRHHNKCSVDGKVIRLSKKPRQINRMEDGGVAPPLVNSDNHQQAVESVESTNLDEFHAEPLVKLDNNHQEVGESIDPWMNLDEFEWQELDIQGLLNELDCC